VRALRGPAARAATEHLDPSGPAASSDRAASGHRGGLDHLLGVVRVALGMLLVGAEPAAGQPSLSAIGDALDLGRDILVRGGGRPVPADGPVVGSSV
jgi:hypothetical protein